MNPHGHARKRTTLAALDEQVGARAAGGRTRPHTLAELGHSRVVREIDRLKGRAPASRLRGISALVGSVTKRTRTAAVSTTRAWDDGAPLAPRGTRASALAVSAPVSRPAWPPTASLPDADVSIAAFAVEAFDEPEVAVATGQPPPPTAVGPPVATALAAGRGDGGALGLDSSAIARDAEDSDQFEREIRALLAGRVPRSAQSATADAAPPAAPAVAPAPAARPHDIFEQMGQNMAYANSFHLPPVSLSHRFDDIERQIVREEAVAATKAEREGSLDLTDEDFALNLPAGGGMAPAAGGRSPANDVPAVAPAPAGHPEPPVQMPVAPVESAGRPDAGSVTRPPEAVEGLQSADAVLAPAVPSSTEIAHSPTTGVRHHDDAA